MIVNPGGLSDAEVLANRQQYGSNVFTADTNRTFIHVLKEVVTEPMFIMLLVACTIYFLSAQYEEGFIMLVSIFYGCGHFVLPGIPQPQCSKGIGEVISTKSQSAAQRATC